MKKLFSLVAIAAVALTSFTSCGEPKTPETPPVAKAKLTLSADAKVAVEATGKFTVTSNIDAASDIAVTVKSSDEKILTITTASVTIAKGKKSVEGTFKGIANGKAKIEITATDVTLSVASVEVIVGEEAPALESILLCDAKNVFSKIWLGPEDSLGFTLWFNNTVLLENLGADYYGESLELKAVDKGTSIGSLTLTKNLGHTIMGSNSTDGYDKLPSFAKIGVAQYIVFSITSVETTDHNVPQTTGWALVSAEDDGNVVNIHEINFPASTVGE